MCFLTFFSSFVLLPKTLKIYYILLFFIKKPQAIPYRNVRFYLIHQFGSAQGLIMFLLMLFIIQSFMSSYFDCIINNIYLQYLPLKYLKMYSINSPAPLCLKLCLLRIDSFQSFLLGRGLRPINNLRVITNTT